MVSLVSITIAGAGYTGGGTQESAARERYSDSCWTVGRSELDSLQHDCASRQSPSEKPSDSASKGLFGRWPLSMAGTDV